MSQVDNVKLVLVVWMLFTKSCKFFNTAYKARNKKKYIISV